MRKCFYALLVMLALFPAVSLAGSSFEDAQGLTAVKQDRLILLPKELFHYKPNARWGESYAYLAKILYPQCF